jgi:nickel-dependent lactate racemase
MALPAGWRLAGVLEPAPLPPVADVGAEVRRSLEQPIGSPRLREMAHGGMKIVLIIDDASRPTPVSLILPAVLHELERGGVRADQITLVPGIGLHRPMSKGEVLQRAGPALEQLRWENHDCDDPDRLAALGVTARKTPVLINRRVAEADLVVSIGCIEPHIIAGFGGGYKNLVPGVAGRPTVAHNHSLNCAPATFNNVGCPIDQNPMRLDLEEAGQMLHKPVFIVNAVLDSALRPVRVVSGGPVAAHREGARTSAAIYGVQAPGPADVVITDSHPMDQDLRQGVKALANTVRALKPGGTLITLVRAEEGVGVFGLASRKLPLGRGGMQRVAPLLVRLVPHLKLAGMGEEDRFFLYFALQAMLRGKLLMYGPTIPHETQANLPFVEFVASPEAAVAAAARRCRPDAQVLVFPHGGSTYPVLP